MRAAMIDRIRLMGTSSPGTAEGVVVADRSSRSGLRLPEPELAALQLRGAWGAAATGAGAGAACAPPPFSINPSTSSFVIRPAEPVPFTWLRSRLWSLAMRPYQR